MTRRMLVCLVLMSLLAVSAPAAASPELAGSPDECDVQLALRDGADPVATGTCPGVRPGAYVETEDISGARTGCSFNFVFDGFSRDVEPVSLGRYIGTAGHCVLVEDGQHSWADGKGPRAFDSTGRHIGHYVFAALDDLRDFALIKLLAGVESNPQMCHWGGPTGELTETVNSTVELKHYGQGMGLGETIPARTAYANALGDPDKARAWGAAIFGDSGSGIIADDGRALGVIVTIGIASSSSGGGTIGITRLGPQVALAEEAVGADFELVTAPRLAG